MKKVFFGLLYISFAALSAPGTTIVDFCGDGSKSFAREADSETKTGCLWEYSESKALIHCRSISGLVYGGMCTSWSVERSYAPNFWLGPDFRIQVALGAGVKTSAKGMLVWKKSDFLNNANFEDVSFAAGNSLSADLDMISANRCDIRFAVKQGEVWYVSDANARRNGLFTIDPTATGWRLIDTGKNYTIGSEAVSVVFDDVQAVGLYMDAVRDKDQTRVVCKAFKVDAAFDQE